jgi:hypothetical protein
MWATIQVFYFIYSLNIDTSTFFRKSQVKFCCWSFLCIDILPVDGTTLICISLMCCQSGV